MTNQELSAALSKAITILTNVKTAVDNKTLQAYPSTSLVIDGKDGEIIVSSDGKIIVDPNRKLQEKAITDSQNFNKHAYICGPKGSPCPTCGGRGII